jgi:hypothetical protein
MKLNNNLFLHTSIGALLVIFGVVTKNTLEQLKSPNHIIGKPLGMAMFVIGWLYTAWILSQGKSNKLPLFIIPSLVILGSVMTMKTYMSNKKKPPMIFPILFSISWIILGFGVGNHLKTLCKYTGLIASILVLISMMGFLPKQRMLCVVDGPGMPLFTIAWFIIIILNSCR